MLGGTLPPTLANLSGAASLTLVVADNLLSGTVPPAYAALQWVALSYNPLLVGALPGAVTLQYFGYTTVPGSVNGNYYHYTLGTRRALARPRARWPVART